MVVEKEGVWLFNSSEGVDNDARLSKRFWGNMLVTPRPSPDQLHIPNRNA